MIGLGLSITNVALMQRNGSPPAETLLKAAIEQRQHVRFTRDGLGFLVQPYSLRLSKGVRILHAVVIATEGDARSDWLPVELDVATLSDIQVYDLTFIPSDAFDASNLEGVKAVVEPVDPFKDATEGDLG